MCAVAERGRSRRSRSVMGVGEGCGGRWTGELAGSMLSRAGRVVCSSLELARTGSQHAAQPLNYLDSAQQRDVKDFLDWTSSKNFQGLCCHRRPSWCPWSVCTTAGGHTSVCGPCSKPCQCPRPVLQPEARWIAKVCATAGGLCLSMVNGPCYCPTALLFQSIDSKVRVA